MSIGDGVLLLGGVILPLALVLYAATAAVVVIVVIFAVYYQFEKRRLVNSLPEKVLLDEIRALRRR